MKIGKRARREGKALFRSCLRNDRLDEKRARAAVLAVLKKKPRGYLPLLHHFSRLVALEIQRCSASVESAMPLESKVRDQIQGQLKMRYGEGLILDFSENPALLGGLRIQVGCDVYDGSVRSRLGRLAASFAAG